MSVIENIIEERRRQIFDKGWDAGHDDGYTRNELVDAAVSYIRADDAGWPWDKKWWKPKDARRNLVKAAALIVAEIERIDRSALALLPPNPKCECCDGSGYERVLDRDNSEGVIPCSVCRSVTS